MDNLARKRSEQVMTQELGQVLLADGGRWVVRTAAGDYHAARATSCLVEPEPGDAVQLTCVADGRCYILAVLERPEGADVSLRADGNLRVQLTAGRFTVAAQHGIDLASGSDLRLASGRLEVTAVDGHVVLQRLSYVAHYVQGEIEKAKAFLGTLDMVVGRLSQRLQSSYRTVAGLDQTRAHSVDVVAETTMNLHGQHAVMTAEKLVKLDGEQIHVG
jgi:hypothetical protein